MERFIYIPVLFCYGTVALAHLLPSVVGKGITDRARGIAGVGVALHFLGLLVAVCWATQSTGFPEALSAAAFGVMGAYATVGRERLASVGLLMAPLAVAMLGTSLVVPHREVAALAHTPSSLWLPIHLGLMSVGLAGFALSSAVGVLYLIVRNRLKQKRLKDLRRLPSLEVLDRMQFRAMLFGFVFLTLGIGVGGAWAAVALEGTWAIDPKVLFTVVIWAWYAVALQVRVVAGWRGRLSALFSIVGFAGMIFSLVVMNFIVKGFHGYVG